MSEPQKTYTLFPPCNSQIEKAIAVGGEFYIVTAMQVYVIVRQDNGEQALEPVPFVEYK